MGEFNSDVVIPTLKLVVSILEKNHISYRFIGSVIAAATNGELHRNLGDIDLIIDEKGKNTLYQALTKEGYYQVGGMFSIARRFMSLETVRHQTLAEVGFFYGRFQPDGSIVMGGDHINVSVEAKALSPTKYSLHGISFTGVNPKAAATRIRASQANPKRKKELQFFKEKGIEPFPDTFVHVNIYGMRFDWMYQLFSTTQNIIGLVRLRFGLSFDPWR